MKNFCKIALLLILIFSFGCGTKLDLDKPTIKGDTIFYVTKTGKKYHYSDCYHLRSSYWIYYVDALLQGYDSCLDCKPSYVGLNALELKFRAYYFYMKSPQNTLDMKIGVDKIEEHISTCSIVEVFNVDSEETIKYLVGQLNASGYCTWNYAINFKEASKYYLWNTNKIIF